MERVFWYAKTIFWGAQGPKLLHKPVWSNGQKWFKWTKMSMNRFSISGIMNLKFILGFEPIQGLKPFVRE
jgi:hypothetical protein